MTRCPVFLLFIVQSTLAYRQDSFLESPDSFRFFPDDGFDDSINAIDNSKRNTHFLRFGRNDEKYRSEYDDFDEFAKPTRAAKREKNDHFARFGRNHEFLRFGRDHEDFLNAQEMYHRIGRSISKADLHKHRGKREAVEEDPTKDETYMRYGKNSNFIRFGRNLPNSIIQRMHKDINPVSHELKNNFQNFKLINLLAELKRRQHEGYIF